MGEATVIFAALVGVLLLLSLGPKPRRVFSNGRWITVADDVPNLREEDTGRSEKGSLQSSDEVQILEDSNG